MRGRLYDTLDFKRVAARILTQRIEIADRIRDFQRARHVRGESVLSLSASGRTTGVMMVSCDDVLQTVLTHKNYALPHAILHWDLAVSRRGSPLSADTFSRPPRDGGRSCRQREPLLHCFRIRHRAHIDCRKFRQEADPHALRR